MPHTCTISEQTSNTYISCPKAVELQCPMHAHHILSVLYYRYPDVPGPDGAIAVSAYLYYGCSVPHAHVNPMSNVSCFSLDEFTFTSRNCSCMHGSPQNAWYKKYLSAQSRRDPSLLGQCRTRDYLHNHPNRKKGCGAAVYVVLTLGNTYAGWLHQQHTQDSLMRDTRECHSKDASCQACTYPTSLERIATGRKVIA